MSRVYNKHNEIRNEMQIKQLNIMKINVIKYLLKSSKSSGPLVDRHFWNRNESRVAKLIESLKTCDQISCGKESSERKSSDLEKDKY